MSCTLFEFVVPSEQDGMNLKTFLRRSCGLSARSMRILKYSDGITRNHKVIKAHEALHTGDVIRLSFPPEHNDIIPTEGNLDILYEDEYILVVNKPAFMPVHPTKIHQRDTLANVVAYYQRCRGEDYVFRALNRLDKDTSGIVFIAKDRLTYALVKDSICKKYIAVAQGMIKEKGTVDAPIALDDGSKIKRCVDINGTYAITHYEPIMYGNSHTLLLLALDTGRTHQIRCHMSSIGHPLAGDDMYGGSQTYINRQALHCHMMSFVHPISKEYIRLEAAIPEDFMKILKSSS